MKTERSSLQYRCGIRSPFIIRMFPLYDGWPMLVDKTNFGLVSIITLTFVGFRIHLVIGQLNEYQFFSVFHGSTSDTPPASQCITIP